MKSFHGWDTETSLLRKSRLSIVDVGPFETKSLHCETPQRVFTCAVMSTRFKGAATFPAICCVFHCSPAGIKFDTLRGEVFGPLHLVRRPASLSLHECGTLLSVVITPGNSAKCWVLRTVRHFYHVVHSTFANYCEQKFMFASFITQRTSLRRFDAKFKPFLTRKVDSQASRSEELEALV